MVIFRSYVSLPEGIWLVVSTIKYEFVNGQDYPIYYGQKIVNGMNGIYIYVDICWVIQ